MSAPSSQERGPKTRPSPKDSGEGGTDAVAKDLKIIIFSEINFKLVLSSQTVTDEGCYLGKNYL